MEPRFFKQAARDENALLKINITNFVDVALTLVIILLIISPFIEQGLQVKLPVSGPARLAVSPKIVITVTRKDRIFVGDRPVTLFDLGSVLKRRTAAGQDGGVIIKGDGRISYQDLVNVLDVVKEAGITKIGLATNTALAP